MNPARQAAPRRTPWTLASLLALALAACTARPPDASSPPVLVSVGGTVSGLTAGGLTLQDNGGDDLTLAAGATAFTFSTRLEAGASYRVTVKSSPTGLTCLPSHHEGTIGSSDVTTVQVSCSAAPAIVTFLAAPSTVAPGGTATLTWSVSGASAVVIDHGVGTVTASGSLAVVVAATTSFTLSATNAVGTTTAIATVTALPLPVITAFAATPATVGYGNPTTLGWSASGAASLTIDGGVGPVSGSSRRVSPLQTTTYTLTATNAAGPTARSTTVTVTGNLWSTRASMHVDRWLLGGDVLDGKVYAVAGAGGASSGTTAEAYDPVADAWTAIPDPPTGRWGLGAVTAGSKLFAIGGATALRTVEAYDPAAGGWTTMAPMPTGRNALALAAVGGKIFAIGGTVDASNTQSSAVEAYDVATNTWEPSARTPMPTARYNVAIAVQAGRIYLLGGNNNTAELDVVEAYDPVGNTWQTRARMPTARSLAMAVTVNGKIYVMGGRGSEPVEQYDPATDSWATIPFAVMPTHRAGAIAGVVNGVVYVVGGAGPSGPSAVVEAYAAP